MWFHRCRKRQKQRHGGEECVRKDPASTVAKTMRPLPHTSAIPRNRGASDSKKILTFQTRGAQYHHHSSSIIITRHMTSKAFIRPRNPTSTSMGQSLVIYHTNTDTHVKVSEQQVVPRFGSSTGDKCLAHKVLPVPWVGSRKVTCGY